MIQKFVLLGVGAFFLYISQSFTAEVSWGTNIQSFVIVVGGALVAALLAFPFSTIKNLLRSLKAMLAGERQDLEEVVRQIVSLARIGRLKGVKALEQECHNLQNPILKLGIELVIDRFERYEIRDILDKESEFYVSQLESQQIILNTLVKLAPAFGFVGTIIGLINVLGTMTSPQDMSSAVSLALLTTFYGLLVSNILFLPLSKKFSEYVKAQRNAIALVVEGLLGIADQQNSKGIQHRLNYYLIRQNRTRGMDWYGVDTKEIWSKKIESGRQNA